MNAKYLVTATVRADGRTEQYGPYYTKRHAELKASFLVREAARHAPLLNAVTNSSFAVRIDEIPAEATNDWTQ